MKLFAALSLILLAAPSMPQQAGHLAPVAPFSVTIEHGERSWRAACSEGCAWTLVTYSCRIGSCSVRLDANGIAAVHEDPTPGTAFAFVLRDSEEGWTASSLHGTAWTKLAWGCGEGRSCEARVDEKGVGPK